MRSRFLIGIVLPIAILVIPFLLINVFAPGVSHAIISYGDGDEARRFPSYNDCAASMCGNSTIRYPFGKCGPGSTHCLDNQTIQINLSDRDTSSSVFHGRVIGNITELSYSTRTLQIAQNYIDNSSLPYYSFFNNSFFSLSEGYMVEQANQRGFQITWTIPPYCPSCEATGGRCYSNNDYDHYDYYCEATGGMDFSHDDDHYCVCHHGVYCRTCSEGHTVYPKLSLRVTADIFFGLCALFSTVVVSCIVVRRQTCCNSTANVEEQSTVALMDYLHSTPPSVENFLNYYSSQVPTRYSYAQIMIYTNNLTEKLGKGGFGTVYKGNLPNGRGIAVKILDESKQSEQQFIAEVATVGTTCHVNLVRLLGYCSQVSIRALVYEYMVNGSLEKYIHGSQEAVKLDWKQLYSIALGTARGIAYLHDNCRNRILHFDIKPHNVLLDSNFLPKVADFGLARIADREESHISVGNRGTLGYAAPEMWHRMYGAVTDRSDVYSYGMLVMEIVGERKNMDFHNRESTSSKFFYPEWAFKQVEKGEFGNLRKENISEAEQDIAKRLCLVGLWCIQFNASRRPSMNKVVQMLEGGAEISIPPYPFPVDPPPVQMSASDPSSSTYSLEVQMINPTNTHIA